MIKNLPSYKINHLIRIYASTIEWNTTDKEKSYSASDIVENDRSLSLDGKKNQLMNLLVSQAMAHFMTWAWTRKGKKVAGDILAELFDEAENERGKSYGTLIQDPRRR
jgi:hypothetical protein